jgi:hypothetical protein
MGKIYENPSLKTENQLIIENYSVDNELDVLTFLNKNGFLKKILIAAEQQIKTYFTDPHLYLENLTDTDDTSETRLFVYISPSEKPKEAFDKFKDLRRNWWLGVSSRVEGKLVISIKYK